MDLHTSSLAAASARISWNPKHQYNRLTPVLQCSHLAPKSAFRFANVNSMDLNDLGSVIDEDGPARTWDNLEASCWVRLLMVIAAVEAIVILCVR